MEALNGLAEPNLDGSLATVADMNNDGWPDVVFQRFIYDLKVPSVSGAPAVLYNREGIWAPKTSLALPLFKRRWAEVGDNNKCFIGRQSPHKNRHQLWQNGRQ